MTNNTDMKKYIQPQTHVVEISVRQPIVINSVPTSGQGVNMADIQSEKIEVSESDGDDDW